MALVASSELYVVKRCECFILIKDRTSLWCLYICSPSCSSFPLQLCLLTRIYLNFDIKCDFAAPKFYPSVPRLGGCCRCSSKTGAAWAVCLLSQIFVPIFFGTYVWWDRSLEEIRCGGVYQRHVHNGGSGMHGICNLEGRGEAWGVMVIREVNFIHCKFITINMNLITYRWGES